MLRLGRERPELKIVADQYCTPTSTADLAVALARLIESDRWGVYHATNAGQCSWHEFACEIFRLANLPVKAIPIPAVEYALKARRPDYSVLDCSKLQSVLGVPQPSWQDALACYLRDRIATT
jgi:dTDP-4-dehydrorhamnose reductase